MARVAHALSSARGESHGPAARGAGGSIPHKNPPFRPSGRIPVRDAKRRGRRDARSGREKRGARKKGVRPGTIVKAQVSLPSDLGLRGRARGSSSGSLGSIRADRRKGRRAACAGLFRSGAHRRQFDAADSPSGRNIQKSCWQQARAKRPEVGRPPGCRRPAQGQLPCAWRRASG